MNYEESKWVTYRHYSPRGYWRVVEMLVAAKEQNGMLLGLTGNAEMHRLKQGMEKRVHLCIHVTD